MDRQRKPNVLTPSDSLYPIGNEAEVVLVTPEMASDWSTSRRYEHNRKVSPGIVGKYLKDMRSGLWKLTRQGLIFDTEGYNIDGGHRLRALANCDHDSLVQHYGEGGIRFWVYPNEPTDTFDSYDQNYRRIAAHLIDEPNSVLLAAGARFLAAVADQDPWAFPRFGRLSTAEILKTKEEWPELSRYASKVQLIKNRIRISGPEHLALLAQAARSDYPDRIEPWLEGLQTGSGLSETDPRLKLRDRFLSTHVALSGSPNRPLRYSLIVKAWNAWAQDEELPTLRWRQDEQIPGVVGFSWDNKTKESGE